MIQKPIRERAMLPVATHSRSAHTGVASIRIRLNGLNIGYACSV
jgi:hypothetical protein